MSSMSRRDLPKVISAPPLPATCEQYILFTEAEGTGPESRIRAWTSGDLRSSCISFKPKFSMSSDIICHDERICGRGVGKGHPAL